MGFDSDRRRFLRLGGTALAASLAGCSAGAQTDRTTDAANGASTTASEGAANDAGARDASPYAAVYSDAIDSVVLIRSARGQGSGFVIDDSHAVTNAHVVGDASTVDVRFTEGRWSDAAVVGTDRQSDLAVVDIDDVPDSAGPLEFVERDPRVGQEVVALGNPFDLTGSATAGIVSGVDRSIPGPTGYSIPDAIQTDAAVNPGNSGGPLMSLDSRVAAVINSGGGENIAFGISAALTKRVAPKLIETGHYDHPYVGVSVTTVTPTIADANDLDEPRGILVVNVPSGGPADGVLQPSETRTVGGDRVPVGGDVLLAVDGTALSTTEDLGSYLALQARPGETVSFDVLRGGSRETVDLELGTRPENPLSS